MQIILEKSSVSVPRNAAFDMDSVEVIKRGERVRKTISIEELGHDVEDFNNNQPTEAQLIMGEAIEHLQGRQKDVYLLVMRHGYSCAQAGKKLGISKWTARDYKDRAVRFLTQYCLRNKGRLCD